MNDRYDEELKTQGPSGAVNGRSKPNNQMIAMPNHDDDQNDTDEEDVADLTDYLKQEEGSPEPKAPAVYQEETSAQEAIYEKLRSSKKTPVKRADAVMSPASQTKSGRIAGSTQKRIQSPFDAMMDGVEYSKPPATTSNLRGVGSPVKAMFEKHAAASDAKSRKQDKVYPGQRDRSQKKNRTHGFEYDLTNDPTLRLEIDEEAEKLMNIDKRTQLENHIM